MQQAVRQAGSGNIVVLGIAPNRPKNDYGYIQAKSQSDGGAMTGQSFVEKPNVKTAQQYLKQGSH